MFLIPTKKSARRQRGSRLSPSPLPDWRSDRMLVELLAMNEEMVVQLRVEQAEAAETTEFIAGMINEHEIAAERLRAALKNRKAAAATRLGAQFEGAQPA
jgi:hypothetical protein